VPPIPTSAALRIMSAVSITPSGWICAARILKGDKLANLRVQQVTKVEFYINLESAKALGITVPLPLSGRADEVIGVAIFCCTGFGRYWRFCDITL
jgi:ABC transporter substrate binding protein